MNSGNKKYEEKLKLITLYTQLKNTYREKINNNIDIQPILKFRLSKALGLIQIWR